jgi:hypothetical protein
MAKKKLTDIAAREFAGDDSFLTRDASEHGIVAQNNDAAQAPDFTDELAAQAPEPGSATTVDEALDVRESLAREQR